VLIDHQARKWVAFTFLLFVLSVAAYYLFHYTDLLAPRPINGPSGGSVFGLVYGSVGSAMMLFALLLGLRKKFRTMRVGRAYQWMQGHVWLGLLSYPIILMHGGFHWGGPLTQIMMWIFTIVVVSGIFGLVLQQYLPTKLLHDVPLETIYDEIDHVLAQVRQTAEERVAAVAERQPEDAFEHEAVPNRGTAATAVQVETDASAGGRLQVFYDEYVKPFLSDKPARSRLSNSEAARQIFYSMRKNLPTALHETLDDLSRLVQERRDLAKQRSLHHWLHGWLLVHVPLSYSLLLMGAVHAVRAIQFAR
jgi:hypothetical protein